MKITKFQDYIRENMNDTPENYVEQALRSILDKINTMFPEDGNEEEPEDEIISFAQAKEKGKEKEETSKKITFADYGTLLVDSNISREAATLTVTLEEAEAWYKIYFMIDLKSAVPTSDKDFSYEDIKDCRVKFVKYNNGDKIEREISKTVTVADIDQEKLIDLKIEVDGEETEGLGIETEK
jgi:hypothetical protein